MEHESKETFEDIKNSQFKDGCCFKKRIADFFLIGVCRAFHIFHSHNKFLLCKLDNSRSHFGFNISPRDNDLKTRSLIDKKKFWLIFQIIAYAFNIKNAGENDPDNIEWKNSHQIIIDGRKCSEIVEEIFNGGWNYPPDDNFHKLTSENDFIDDEIIEELNLSEVLSNDNDYDNT
ncbi:MAG: hypothetical protein ACTSVV_05130 [Promethearchaeota archaeon]